MSKYMLILHKLWVWLDYISKTEKISKNRIFCRKQVCSDCVDGIRQQETLYLGECLHWDAVCGVNHEISVYQVCFECFGGLKMTFRPNFTKFVKFCICMQMHYHTSYGTIVGCINMRSSSIHQINQTITFLHSAHMSNSC